jgi:tetratricopeptide (TPR) repeat protein
MPVEAPVTAEINCTRCGQPMPEGSYWCPSCGKLNATLRVRIVFAIIVLTVIVGFAVTKWYVSYLRNLESTLAQRWFTRGEEAIAKNYPSVAVDDYRNALAYDSGNQQYRLHLAEALVKEDRLAEARANLLSLWSQHPADARVNLDLARLYAEQKKPDLAVRYYRAAIDGVWAEDPLRQRTEARFELVHYLMQQSDKSRATAELIAIEAEAPDDAATLMKTGDLLLELGENTRAGRSYDAVLKQDPKDAAALSGAGRAALAIGDYPEAVRQLTLADELTGNNPQNSVLDQLSLAREALNVDPYLRNLTIAERARRVASAFGLAMDRLKSCARRRNIVLDSEAPSTTSTAGKPALANKKSGYLVPVPTAAAPDPLQLLYNSGLQRQPGASATALRKDPDAMRPTMDFVLDVMRATETCPIESMPERALQLIAQHEAGR